MNPLTRTLVLLTIAAELLLVTVIPAGAEVSVVNGTSVMADYTLQLDYNDVGGIQPSTILQYILQPEVDNNAYLQPARDAVWGLGLSYSYHTSRTDSGHSDNVGIGYSGIVVFGNTTYRLGEPYTPPMTTVTETNVVTTTVTRTITGPNGETSVVTEVQTITIGGEAPGKRNIVLGLGVLAFLILLLLARR